MGEGPLSGRSAATTVLLWLAVLAGLLFAGGLFAGFFFVAGDYTPPPQPQPSKSSTPTPSITARPATPSPSANDPLANINTASPEFAIQSRAFLCYTVKKAVVAPGPARTLGIARVQWALTAAGYNAGEIDGWFTAQTQAAVRELQNSNGIKLDSRVGPETWQLLEQSVCGGGATGIPVLASLVDFDPESEQFGAAAYSVLCSMVALPDVTTATYDVPPVLLAQYALNQGDPVKISVDGQFGDVTQAQLKAFQMRSGAKVTGAVDAPTWKKLRTGICPA
ncbi:MAG: peptidoglycan-binding protein [Actinobacteria bacterium]|nr:peptidoglycan-binding protein [Actinomycetota bacterium]